MTAYYNEFDPKAAAWLRELIAAGLIAPGDVDTRSITEVQPDDLKGYVQCHFFAGIGGWSLALRRALWADDRPVWTGSCPCQPFSLAGKQKGFEDSRHLWPEFRRLIAERRPATLFGEQVASASDWLRLVRSDLEGLGYAVGAMPVEAASAGADHLRDRFWFVGNDTRVGRREGQPEPVLLVGKRTTIAGAGRGVLANADHAGSQGRAILPERAGERTAGADGVAHAARIGSGPGFREGDQVKDRDGAAGGGRIDGALADTNGNASGSGRRDAGEVRGLQEAECQPEHGSSLPGGSGAGGDVPDSIGLGVRGARPGAPAGAPAGMQGEDEQRQRLWPDAGPVRDAGEYEWATGADGKARRVKPGVRLLVDGFPCRVGLLRGFGNAIDPRPAAAFIKAADEAMISLRGGQCH